MPLSQPLKIKCCTRWMDRISGHTRATCVTLRILRRLYPADLFVFGTIDFLVQGTPPRRPVDGVPGVGRGRSASLPPRPAVGPGHARRLGHVLRRGPLRCDMANRANCAKRWEGGSAVLVLKKLFLESGFFSRGFPSFPCDASRHEHNKQACARARDEKRKTPIWLRLQHESAGVVTTASRRSWYAERQHNAGNFPCSGRFCRGCAIAHEVACGSTADASLSLRHGRAGNT